MRVLLMLLLSSCSGADIVAGALRTDLSGSRAAQERQANREANEADARKREQENAAIRETNRRLQQDDTPVDPSLPATLTREMVADALATVKPAVMACRRATTDIVNVDVRVGRRGNVYAIDVTSTPDPVLGRCVAGAVERATFPKTQRGGSFRYPFVL